MKSGLNNGGLNETSGDSFTRGYNRFIDRLEDSYFFIVSMILLIGSNLGIVTAMFTHYNHGGELEMIVSVSATMIVNIACILRVPMNWLFNLFVISVLVNSLLLALNF